MKRIFMILSIMTFVMAAGVTNGLSAEVVQGKCIEFDPQQQKVVIEEYDINFSEKSPYGNPTGILFEGNIKNAKVGILPEPGDILRIAYKLEGDRKQVIRIMNVSKQDLRKK